MNRPWAPFMSNWILNSFIYIFLLSFTGCDLIKMKDDADSEDSNQPPIARVHDQYLYAHDIEGIVTSGMSKGDSADRVSRFVNTWIKKQLLIDEAATKIEFDEAEIERKMLDYKYSLMGYEYQSFYVSQNLNTEVTEEEVQKYYETNLDNFILKQNIIRGRFIKLPKGAPKLDRVSDLIRSKQIKKIEELNSYCLSFATQYHLDDSVWLDFEEVTKSSPLQEIPNKVQFLKNNRYVETTDEMFKYFLKIEEYRISDNISPLEFVREDVKNIIINKRKVELAKQLEEDVYQRATKNNGFEIYNN